MSARIGQSHVLSRNTGTGASPVYDVIANVADVEFSSSADAAEASTRASRFRTYASGMVDVSLTFNLVLNASDTDRTTIRDAHIAGTPMELIVSTGAIGTSGTVASGGVAGVEWFRMGFVITGYSQSEPLNNVVTIAVEAKPATMTGFTAGWQTVIA
jgi:hypothetical protein